MLEVVMRILTACLVFGFLLSGCQAVVYGTAADLNSIKIGMTRNEVVGFLGEPMTTAADSGIQEERLTYARMARMTGWSPTLYDIILREGRVIRFGAQQ